MASERMDNETLAERVFIWFCLIAGLALVGGLWVSCERDWREKDAAAEHARKLETACVERGTPVAECAALRLRP